MAETWKNVLEKKEEGGFFEASGLESAIVLAATQT